MQQIADKSKVPISTVERILNGKTENPSFDAVTDIVTAMNGSVDVLIGIRDNSTSDKHTKCDVTNCAIIDLYERQKLQDEEWKENLKITYDERIEGIKKLYNDLIVQNEEKHKAEIALKNLWIHRMFWICVGMILFLICIIICDFFFGGSGLIRFY